MNNKFIYQAVSMIDDDLIAEAENSVKTIKTLRIKKVLLITAATILLFSLTALAASIILGSREGHVSNEPTYYDVPTVSELKKEIGISIKVVEKYNNGYVFKSGHISELTDYDTENNLIGEYKGLHCLYENNDDRLSIDIDKAAFPELGENEKIVNVYKNSEIRYVSYVNKLVPSDYRPTEQELLDEKKGKYVLSYGADTVRTIKVQILSWKYNGLNYSICALDNDITVDELVEMAKETIDYQEES